MGRPQVDQASTIPPPTLATDTPSVNTPSKGTQTSAFSSKTGEASPLDKADVDSWLDGYLPFALNTSDIPGAVVVVVKDGAILTVRGFGYADVEKALPVDGKRTLFRPGSVSKLVTWTAVMQLVEQGRLDLDADINRYLDFKIPPRAGKPVTMREMMMHTAGFEESAKYLLVYDKSNFIPLSRLMKKRVPERIFDSGTTPAYSNYATALAGYVVERISGISFDDYVEQRIFAPLEMRTATFRQPLPAGLAPLMAKGYAKPGQPSLGFEIVNPAPAGAMSASGVDMANFMIAHLQGGEFNGRRILSTETTALMHDSSLEKVNPASLLPPLNRMQLGFFDTNVNGRKVIAHLGDTEAFHTALHLFMNEGVGLYLSVNSGGREDASNTLRNAIFHDFADRYFPDTAPNDGQVEESQAKRHAQMMVGTWESSRRSESSFFSLFNLFGQVKVQLNDKGELLIPALLGPNQRPREWVEIAPFIWRDRNGEDRIAAKVVGDRVVRWSMDFMSPFMVFDRVPALRNSAWILPIGGASIVVMLLTALSMPVGWIVRRRHRLAHHLQGHARKVALAVQLSAIACLVVLAGWGGIVASLEATLDNATDVLDSWMWILQIGGLITFLTGLVASTRNLQLAFKHGQGYTRKIWSVLFLAATLLLTYLLAAFNLFSMSVSY